MNIKRDSKVRSNQNIFLEKLKNKRKGWEWRRIMNGNIV
jgi:hypothetical protein